MATDVRYATHPHELERLRPDELRARFVVGGLFEEGAVHYALSMSDRLLVGGAVPAGATLELSAPAELSSEQLLDRRELALVCLSGSGEVEVGGATFGLRAEDILYAGQGAGPVRVAGDAAFYLVSAPAHRPLPTTLARKEDAETHVIGDAAVASLRTLRKYLHEDGVATCELAVGITTLSEGSVWNTMPCHTHERRTEIYLYFGLPADERVVHLCGRPEATRSLVLGDREAVISPPWSIHTGAGTHPYRFVWSTGGENLAYNDMDPVPTHSLR